MFVATCRILSGKGCQSPAGSHLDKDRRPRVQQLANSLPEVDGMANVTRPVIGVTGLFILYPLTTHVGDEPQTGGAASDLADRLGQRFMYTGHHAGMKRMGGMQRLNRKTTLPDPLYSFRHTTGLTCQHAEIG